MILQLRCKYGSQLLLLCSIDDAMSFAELFGQCVCVVTLVHLDFLFASRGVHVDDHLRVKPEPLFLRHLRPGPLWLSESADNIAMLVIACKPLRVSETGLIPRLRMPCNFDVSPPVIIGVHQQLGRTLAQIITSE